MALTPAQQKMLEDLTALAEAPDADDFEIEIFSGDKGARVPYSKAASWLHAEFGIGEAPKPAAGEEGQGEQKPTQVVPAVRKLFKSSSGAGSGAAS